MEVSAFTKQAHISTRKARLVADAVRNMNAVKALDVLYLSRKRAAQTIAKTLQSAIANATAQNITNDGLFISKIEVNEGPALKRFHPSTRGRIHPYKKRSSHIKIVLASKVVIPVKAIKQTDAKVEKEKKS